MTIVSLILARSENNVIGRGNDLPWHLPADLKRFKNLTTGHTIVMGRKTFDSIGRPLPNRRSIVITRQEGWRREGVETAHSLHEALEKSKDQDEVFVIGGEEIFRTALPLAQRIYLTTVHGEVTGDTLMPDLPPTDWTVAASETHPPDERNVYGMTFSQLERPR